MLLIGSHVSFDKEEQLVKSTKEAISYGSSVFMFYTGAPQNTNRSKIKDEKTLEALELMKENGIDYHHVVVHAPYIINLANRTNLDFGIRFLTEELERCQSLGIQYLILHPGSHVGAGTEVGIQNIIDGLNTVFLNNHSSVKVLLETMAGKGTEIGSKLEELQQIIKGINDQKRVGICLDTCHLNDAGYDITQFDTILDRIDHLVGIDKVHCIHINDSKNPIAAHKDRHENLGFGSIGFDTLLKIIYNPRLKQIPKILETPYIDHQYPPYRYEIEMIRKKKFDGKVKDKMIN